MAMLKFVISRNKNGELGLLSTVQRQHAKCLQYDFFDSPLERALCLFSFSVLHSSVVRDAFGGFGSWIEKKLLEYITALI